MSESRLTRGLRQKTEEPKPTKKGLKCPVCGGNTVMRDVCPEDRWYVEFCYGGKIVIEDEEKDEQDKFVVFECPYYDAGWER